MRISQVDDHSAIANKRFNTGFEYGWQKPQSADGTAGRNGKRRIEDLFNRAGVS
jgi:hypothetical protein